MNISSTYTRWRNSPRPRREAYVCVVENCKEGIKVEHTDTEARVAPKEHATATEQRAHIEQRPIVAQSPETAKHFAETRQHGKEVRDVCAQYIVLAKARMVDIFTTELLEKDLRIHRHARVLKLIGDRRVESMHIMIDRPTGFDGSQSIAVRVCLVT